MEINFAIKHLTKKKPLLRTFQIVVPGLSDISSLSELLSGIVKYQVGQYNLKPLEKEESGEVSLPLPEDLSFLIETGKATFGKIYNSNQVIPEEAIENALNSFTDGLFAVFWGEEEILYLDQMINLTEGKVFTFIRLTFLSGTFF